MLIFSSIAWLVSASSAFWLYFYYPCTGANADGLFLIIFSIPILLLWLFINIYFYTVVINNKKVVAGILVLLVVIGLLLYFSGLDMWSIGEIVCQSARK